MNDNALMVIPSKCKTDEAQEAAARKRQYLKKCFLQALKFQLGNISQSCEDIGIRRSTYYDWIKEDLVFKADCEDVNQSMIHLAESQLLKNIMKGKEISLIFYLTNRAGDQWKHKSVQENTGTFKFEGDINLDAKFTEHANDIMRRFGVVMS
jgi:hypothetical protein